MDDAGLDRFPCSPAQPRLSPRARRIQIGPAEGQSAERSIAPAPRAAIFGRWEEKGGWARCLRCLRCGMLTGLGGSLQHVRARAAQLAGALPPAASPE